MMELVFVVDMDPGTCQVALRYLEGAGYSSRVCSAADVVEAALNDRPSLILIAVFSKGAGPDLCKRIRENAALARTPIFILVGKGSAEDAVAVMESGADDCLVNPSPREFEARTQAVLRRSARPAPIPIAQPVDVEIDNAAMKLSVRGDEVATTALQFRLVDYLARHRGQVFTRDILLDAVWGETQFVNPRSVDACIRRIRHKIEPDINNPTYLKTIRGVGYRFDAVAAWARTEQNCNCSACKSPVGVSRAAYEGTARRKAFAVHH